MLTVMTGFWLFSAALFGTMIYWLIQLRGEVAMLAFGAESQADGRWTIPSSLVGERIEAYLPIPRHLQNKTFVLMVSSPTCPPCHVQLAELTESFSTGMTVPFLCVLNNGNQEAYWKLVQQYQEEIAFVPAGDEIIVDRLQIKVYPTVLIIDPDGVIRYEGGQLVKVMKMLAQSQLTLGDHG